MKSPSIEGLFVVQRSQAMSNAANIMPKPKPKEN